MKTTKSFYPDILIGKKGKQASPHSAKISDAAIRVACTEQFRVDQGGSKPGHLFCAFDDVDQYADDKRYTGKRCSAQYSRTAKYTSRPTEKSWSQGFRWVFCCVHPM